MNKTAWIVCNAFLSKASPDKKNALVRYLPSKQQELLKALAVPEKSPFELTFDIERPLSCIHPSWISPFLRNLPETEIGLFLSCLPQLTARELQKSVLYSKEIPSLTPFAKRYLQNMLFEHLKEDFEELLPIELIPHSALNTLLELKPSSMQTLVEFLGLHDLSVEMKQIIDTAKIKKIHASLDKEKEAYLKILMQKQEPVLFKRMELSKWDGSEPSLQKVIYLRGLNRLAKALHFEDPSLFWYITRLLPWEDSQMLHNLNKPLEHSKAISILIHQILEIIPLISHQTSKENL